MKRLLYILLISFGFSATAQNASTIQLGYGEITSDLITTYDVTNNSNKGSIDFIFYKKKGTLGNNEEIQTLKIDSFLFKSLYGCTHSAYAEYDPNAFIDNGTCSTIYQFGCTTANPYGVNPTNYYCDSPFPTEFGDLGQCSTETFVQEVQIASDNNDLTTFNSLLSNSCAVATFGAEWVFDSESFDDCWNQTNPCIPGIEGCMNPLSSYYNPNANVPGNCEDVVIGCMDSTYIDYNAIANSSDPLLCITLIVNGCTDDSFVEYNSEANFDNGSCVNEVVSGCIDDCYFEFNELANTDDDSCQTLWLDAYQSLSDEFTLGLSSLQQALDTWNTTIDLGAGWNMFGYGCPTSIDLAEGLSNHTESVVIVKDNNGSVYMPEFGFNGIGDLTPGFGYQIKVSVAIEGFSLCDWYVNDIPEDNIVSLQDSLELIISQIGCIDSLACNYDITHIYYDGSCEYISCVNCMDESACNYNSEAIIDYGLCEYPQYGFDCNEFVIAEIGDEFQGGILFYINETGQHGIVAAPEDIGSYAWGCPETPISGADGQAVGAGYLNTLEIVSGCSQTPIAASRSLAYVNEGYLDWYLPSFDELTLMYSNISQGSPNGNSGGFINDYYWSSSESVDNIRAWLVYFGSGNSFDYLKQNEISVRPIRSF